MSPTLYLATCLLVLLAGIAVLVLVLARWKRDQDLRRLQAHQMTQALQCYSRWVSAQRLAVAFRGEGPEAAAALDEACTIRRAWFPELAGDLAELMAVHNRIVNFLATQQQIWLRDPEHWLESEHDKRFMALWRQHRFALQALHEKLQQVASVRIPQEAPGQSTYA